MLIAYLQIIILLAAFLLFLESNSAKDRIIGFLKVCSLSFTFSFTFFTIPPTHS